MGISDELKRIKDERSDIDRAKNILTNLREWRSEANRKEAVYRWVLELIQNAFDSAQNNNVEKLTIKITFNEEKLIFEHNGGPFKKNELVALICSGSTKDEGTKANSNSEGFFGRGFLVTHVLSTNVNISSCILDDHIYKSFSINLNRTGTMENIADDINECINQMDNTQEGKFDQTTAYTYQNLGDELFKEASKEGIHYITKLMPLIFTFNPKLYKIEIKENNIKKEYHAKRENVCTDRNTKDIIRIESFGSVLKVNGDGASIAVLIDEEKKCVKLPEGIPNIFLKMPLTETEKLRLPVIITGKFDKKNINKDRHILNNPREEQSKIDQALKLIFEAWGYLNKNSYTNIHALFRLADPEDSLENKDFWKERMSEIIQLWLEQPIVRIYDKEDFEKPKNVIFPSDEKLHEKKKKNEEKYNDLLKHTNLLLKMYGEKNIIDEEILVEWCDIRNNWIELTNESVGNKKGIFDMISEIADYEYMDNLIERFDGDEKKARNFLAHFYGILKEIWEYGETMPDQFTEYQIYPNQNGKFCRPGELSVDEDIDGELKEIGELLHLDINTQLLDKKVSKIESLKDFFYKITGENKKNSVGIMNEIYNHLSSNDLKDIDYNFKKACIRFIVWLSKNKDTTKGLNIKQIPFLFEDNKLKRIEDGEDNIPLVPKVYFENGIIELIKILPNSIFLSENYAAIMDFLQEKDVCTSSLFYSTNEDLEPKQLKHLLVDKVEGNHTIDNVELTAVRGFKEILENNSLLKNPDNLMNFLNFIFNYLLKKDNSWREYKEKTCSCKTTGKISIKFYPSKWILLLKKYEWVPDEKTKRDGSKEEIELRVADQKSLEPFIKQFIDTYDAILFLARYFDFNKLDLIITRTAKGVDEKKEEIIADLSNILTIMEKDPEITKKFFEMERKRKSVENNKRMGELMERLIEKIINYNSISTYEWNIGGDLAVLKEDLDENEYLLEEGSIGISAIEINNKKYKFLLEIKTTTGNNVRMTRKQAEFASIRYINNYILCILDISNNPDIITESLSEDNANLEKVATLIRLVPNIGQLIKDRFQDLKKIEDSKEDIKEEKEGIKVEYYNDSVSFVVNKSVWEDSEHSLSLQEWIEKVKQENKL